ncbi:hypothetical protein [Pontitalea aquivivens]|uniref:hypothetical protein n=1 Tax=Pontitalea aquivivens TaxID=3388663 RepID=UPI003970BF82
MPHLLIAGRRRLRAIGDDLAQDVGIDGRSIEHPARPAIGNAIQYLRCLKNIRPGMIFRTLFYFHNHVSFPSVLPE